MTDIILVVILLLIVGSAIFYIKKEKQRGATCIGCPHSGECAKRRQGGCGSHTEGK